MTSVMSEITGVYWCRLLESGCEITGDQGLLDLKVSRIESECRERNILLNCRHGDKLERVSLFVTGD